jgi:2-polyprenyl-3-methyl-5-hydroxy-6-metoxy-1,4-benzoquinol methylase
MTSRQAALRAWRSFAGAGAPARAFLAARLAVVPLTALRDAVRDVDGEVLSLGAGHGVVERALAELRPDLRFEGVELDEQRVALAARTQGRAPRVRIQRADVREVADVAGYDAALAVDVLHHVPEEDHGSLLVALAAALRPGGSLIIKDIGRTPLWRWAVNRVHDRIVSGPGPIRCRNPDEWAELCELAGLEVAHAERVRHPSPYPHVLVVARKPASPH